MISNSSQDSRLRVLECTSTLTVNNSVVLADIPGLTFTCPANKSYTFQAILRTTSAAAADFRFRMNCTGGAAGTVSGLAVNSNFVATTDYGSDLLLNSTGQVSEIVILYGTITQGVAAGTHKLQFAQQTANVSDSKIFQYSQMQVHFA